jgi:hypothetical protein
LFGETQSRIIITTAKKDAVKMKKTAVKNRVACTELGKTGGSKLVINVDWASKKNSKKLSVDIADIVKLWEGTVNEHV